MSKQEAKVNPAAADADYAQFAKRDLDKMSWLYPLVNNRLGDLLHLQLRHEHLFFVKKGSIVDEIGYGEDGERFHERDKGKQMTSLGDLTPQGYWLIPPRLNAKAAVAALSEIKDGAYYSVFSNQCQDWAARVRKKTLSIQRHQGLNAPDGKEADPRLYKAPAPTVPAAWYFGMISLVVGILGLLAPSMAGFHYLKFVALLLLGVGVSDLIYAFASRCWNSFLSTVFFGLLAITGGGLMWANSYFLFANSNGLLAVILACVGAARIFVAARSRPFRAWVGTLIAGILLLVTAGLAWVHRDGTAAGWILGAGLSISFIASGVSTISLNFTLRNRERSEATTP